MYATSSDVDHGSVIWTPPFHCSDEGSLASYSIDVQRRRADGRQAAAQGLQLRVADGDVLDRRRIGDLRVDGVAARPVEEQPAAAAQHDLLLPVTS